MVSTSSPLLLLSVNFTRIFSAALRAMAAVGGGAKHYDPTVGYELNTEQLSYLSVGEAHLTYGACQSVSYWKDWTEIVIRYRITWTRTLPTRPLISCVRDIVMLTRQFSIRYQMTWFCVVGELALRAVKDAEGERHHVKPQNE